MLENSLDSAKAEVIGIGIPIFELCISLNKEQDHLSQNVSAVNIRIVICDL